MQKRIKYNRPVIGDPKPHFRFEAVATCIRTYEINRDRMCYDLYRKRGLPIGLGVVERASKQVVRSRFKPIIAP